MSHHFRFPDQHDKEEVYYLLRRHILVMIPRFGLFIVMLLMPVVLFFIFRANLAYHYDPSEFLSVFAILFMSFYYMAVLVFFYHLWIDYYLDVYIITNERILDIEQRGLFSRIISELSIDKVQDVTTDTHGFFKTIFSYGDINVLSSGAYKTIVFPDVPHAATVAQKIIQLSKEAEQKAKRVYSHHPTPASPSSEGPVPAPDDNEINFSGLQ